MYPFSPPRLQINLAKCSSIPAAFSDQTEPTVITIPGDSALGGHMINKALIFLPSIVLVAGDYIILYNPIQKSRHIPYKTLYPIKSQPIPSYAIESCHIP